MIKLENFHTLIKVLQVMILRNNMFSIDEPSKIVHVIFSRYGSSKAQKYGANNERNDVQACSHFSFLDLISNMSTEVEPQNYGTV